RCQAGLGPLAKFAAVDHEYSVLVAVEHILHAPAYLSGVHRAAGIRSGLMPAEGPIGEIGRHLLLPCPMGVALLTRRQTGECLQRSGHICLMAQMQSLSHGLDGSRE